MERSVVVAQMTLTESFNDQPLEQEQPNEDAFEFSDDPDMDFASLTTKIRTRSQSRTKESSVPPAEPVKKQTKVKRGAKKADPDYGPRRRRKIVEVKKEELSDISDDDSL